MTFPVLWQLVLPIANFQRILAHIVSARVVDLPKLEPCLTMEIAGIPRWAFLALSAISNLHNSLVNIDASSKHSKGTPNEGDANTDLQTSVFKGNVYNGFISGDVLAQFKKQNKPPGYLAQLILSIIGPIIAIIGIFLPIMFPVFATVEASATVAEEEITNLAATVAARLKE